MHANHPRGAGLGRDTNRRRPGLVDYGWTAENGSRAQRREILRQLKTAKRQGHPEAAETLADFQTYATHRASLVWHVSIPGREPFTVICPQRVTAREILLQWPGAMVEAHQ